MSGFNVAVTLGVHVASIPVAFGDCHLQLLAGFFTSHDGVATMAGMSSATQEMAESFCFPPAFG